MERIYMIRSKKRIAAMTAIALATVMSATSVAGISAASAAPTKIKVWAWYPNFKEVVETFNATHTDVQV